ncbi:hypothetical protein F511_00669 [Dorcoceras hygrometricum]|nr:hypothetical protein F511_00669 [Dorcoceras hygrometricum]
MKLLIGKLLSLPLPLIHGFPFKLFSFAAFYFFTNRNPPKIQSKITDFAVHFLLSNLKRQIIHHTRLILQAKNQVEILESDICLLKAFLKDSAKKRLKNEAVEEFVREIRVVVSEGEYVIFAFKNLAGQRRDRDFWKKLGFLGMIKLVGIAKEVGIVRNKVKRIYSSVRRIDFSAPRIGDLPGEAITEVPLVRKENVEVKEIEVVPVICMPRVGMMAPAQKISRNLRIAFDYPICKNRAFIAYLAQRQCSPMQKGVFLMVLHQDMGSLVGRDEVLQESFPKRTTDISMVITKSHGGRLRKVSVGRVCLIVLDDVRYSEILDQLKVSVPDSNNASRILATSRMKKLVVSYS